MFAPSISTIHTLYILVVELEPLPLVYIFSITNECAEKTHKSAADENVRENSRTTWIETHWARKRQNLSSMHIRKWKNYSISIYIYALWTRIVLDERWMQRRRNCNLAKSACFALDWLIVEGRREERERQRKGEATTRIVLERRRKD